MSSSPNEGLITSSPRAYARGAKSYGYVIDRDGKGFFVSTVASADRANRYAELKGIVDRAVRTLSFQRPATFWISRAVPGVVGVLVLAAVGIAWRRRTRPVT
jgi:hypothetical protein